MKKPAKKTWQQLLDVIIKFHLFSLGFLAIVAGIVAPIKLVYHTVGTEAGVVFGTWWVLLLLTVLIWSATDE